MTSRRDPTKAVQLGFLAVLVVATAQVAWWITDQRWLAWGGHDRTAALYQAEAEAVTSLVGLRDWFAQDPASDAERQALASVIAEFPHLVFDPVAGIVSVRPESIEELAAEAASRINRYAWEGGFFLLVLIVGMAVLTRAIRHDAELRRRQQNFVAAVSHEFKSPLASMRLSAETLATRSTDQDSRRLGQRLLEDGDRLLRMVDNLLDTARIDDGRITLRREPVLATHRGGSRKGGALAAGREPRHRDPRGGARPRRRCGSSRHRERAAQRPGQRRQSPVSPATAERSRSTPGTTAPRWTSPSPTTVSGSRPATPR